MNTSYFIKDYSLLVKKIFPNVSPFQFVTFFSKFEIASIRFKAQAEDLLIIFGSFKCEVHMVSNLKMRLLVVTFIY